MIKPSSIVRCCAFAFVAFLGCVYLVACAPSQPSKPQNAKKTCVDCHSDYAKRFSTGVVHAPVQEAKCNTCHRTHGQIGGVFLRQDPPDLCFRCHRDLANALQQQERVHAPVADGECHACHEPHNSANKALLTEQGGNLCFKCHSQEPFQGKNVHKPVADGCGSCHAAHGSSSAGLLSVPASQLCGTCHQLDEAVFVERHGGFPVTTNCQECHSVHSSDNDRLLKAQIHAPIADLDCRACHQSPKTGDSALVTEGAGLCLSCHEVESTGSLHAPVAEGNCLDCHSPHASDFSGMLSASPDSLCFKCHEFNYLGPAPKKPGEGSAHTIVKDGDCMSCHLPHHAAPGQQALLKAQPEQLCLECHVDVGQNKKVTHAPAAEGQCATCHLSHESPVAGVLSKSQQKLCAECHESVTEDMGKLSLHKPFSSGQCSSCHAPHGSDSEMMLLASGAGTCDSCHEQLAGERSLDARHEPFVAGQCATCHDPHASDETILLSGPLASICLECHADKQPLEGYRNKHENCASCHAPHGNEGDSYLVQSAPQLCLNCHSVDEYWKKGVGHQPAVDGECVACHDPHFALEDQIVKPDWDKRLCATCHEVDSATLKASHQNIDPDEQSCRSCHDPHGGADNSLTHPIKHDPFMKGECIVCHTGA